MGPAIPDELFDIPPGDLSKVLALAPVEVVEALEARGVDVRGGADLTDDLADAGCVYVHGPDVDAIYVALAAGRLLIIGHAARIGALQDGLDCYFVGHVDEAVAILRAAAVDGEAFAPVAALGRLAVTHLKRSAIEQRAAAESAAGL